MAASEQYADFTPNDSTSGSAVENNLYIHILILKKKYMFLWKKKEMLASSKKEYKIMKPLFCLE